MFPILELIFRSTDRLKPTFRYKFCEFPLLDGKFLSSPWYIYWSTFSSVNTTLSQKFGAWFRLANSLSLLCSSVESSFNVTILFRRPDRLSRLLSGVIDADKLAFYLLIYSSKLTSLGFEHQLSYAIVAQPFTV